MDDFYKVLYEKLARLQWLLQRHHMQAHSEYGPMADSIRGQVRVLALLRQIQTEISTKDLSYLLGIRQQSLNDLLNKLERGGYITRIPSQSDKRVIVVQLTAKGKSEEYVDADISSIFDSFTKDELRLFGEFLDRIIQALDAQFGCQSEERSHWADSARSRIGDDRFERMISMRGNFFSAQNGDNSRDCCDMDSDQC